MVTWIMSAVGLGTLILANPTLAKTLEQVPAGLVAYLDADAEQAPNLVFSGVGYRCLAHALAFKRSHEPRYRESVSRLARHLLENADLDGDGRYGWGLPPDWNQRTCAGPGTWDASGDGSCNPRNTAYMFQTGLSIRCLTEAYDISSEAPFLIGATRAVDDSWHLGTSELPGCEDCFYYWYSYSANERGRFVRNTSVLMGSAVAHLHRVTGKPSYRRRALEVANAELFDQEAITAHYYGRLDFKTAARQPFVEDHLPMVAFTLYDLGTALGTDRYDAASAALMEAWRTCDSRACDDNLCKVWSGDPGRCINLYTHYYCSLTPLRPAYARFCKAALDATGGRGAFPAYMRLYDRSLFQ